jgi:hypothetical protein
LLVLLGFLPLGFAAVGTTAGTLAQDLSKAIRLVACLGTLVAGTENSLHVLTLLTRPKTKDWQALLVVHCAWQAAAVLMPVGWESGCALPLPAGAVPQIARGRIGEAEIVAKKADAAMMVVNECMFVWC